MWDVRAIVTRLVPAGLSAGEMLERIMAPKVLKLIEYKRIVKVIPVPGKLVNIVVLVKNLIRRALHRMSWVMLFFYALTAKY